MDKPNYMSLCSSPLKGKTNKLPSFKRQTNVAFIVGPSVNYLPN